MTVRRPVVLDNTVLANFALAECAGLVTRLWGGAICTTSSVVAEHRQGVAKGSVPGGAWKDLRVIELEGEEASIRDELPPRLGPGESSALAVVISRGGTLATDDLIARKVAATKGVAVTGTVGILVGCIRKGLIDLSEGNRLLEEMVDHGYHSPTRSLDDYA